MSDFQNSLQQKLQQRRDLLQWRDLNRLKVKKNADFFSNDYLGLAQTPELQKKILDAITSIKDAPLFGSTGSRLLSGNHPLYLELEGQLAQYYRSEAALLMNSGYAANIAILSSLPKRNDVIYYDDQCHASIKQGMRLSLAKALRFRHNDLGDLRSKIEKQKSGQIFVVVESIYSMSGDFAPLIDLVELKKQHHFVLMVDEAHSNGLFGQVNYWGNGLCCQLGIDQQVDIRNMPFGKAFGAVGAVIVSNQLTKEYLVNFALPFIYSTALPLANIIALQETLNYLQQNFNNLRNQLEKNILYFQNHLTNQNGAVKHSLKSTIQKITLGNAAMTIQLARRLQDASLEIRAILPPTVPAGQEQLRIILHSFNTRADIKTLCETINQFKGEFTV